MLQQLKKFGHKFSSKSLSPLPKATAIFFDMYCIHKDAVSIPRKRTAKLLSVLQQTGYILRPTAYGQVVTDLLIHNLQRFAKIDLHYEILTTE